MSYLLWFGVLDAYRQYDNPLLTYLFSTEPEPSLGSEDLFRHYRRVGRVEQLTEEDSRELCSYCSYRCKGYKRTNLPFLGQVRLSYIHLVHNYADP